MATPGKVSKKVRKKLLQAKTSLSSPYSVSWSPLPQNSMHFILNTLTLKLRAVGLEKREVKGPRRKRQGEEAAQQEPERGAGATPERGAGATPERGAGWTDQAARRQLAVGINEVTKALERNELRLVLVCKSAQPVHMTSHLVALCSSRQVPACQVPRLSDSVAQPLGLKSILALGFRRGNSQQDDVFSDTVDAIIPRVPPNNVAWLPGTLPSDAGGRSIKMDDTKKRKGVKRKVEGREAGEAGEGGGREAGEGEGREAGEAGDQDRGEVRVQEDRCEDRVQDRPTETEAAALLLQPLKVKKIIPNPSKIRKQK